jgi:hypothetical protein
VPVHLTGFQFPAPGLYGIGAQLSITAVYSTAVNIDDTRPAIYGRFQNGASLSGATVAAAVLTTPRFTNVTSLVFTAVVDEGVPNGRTLVITSSTIELGTVGSGAPARSL